LTNRFQADILGTSALSNEIVMTIRSSVRWLLVPLLLLSVEFSRAGDAPPPPVFETPAGTFDFGFDEDHALFDVTGDYGVSLTVNEDTPRQIEIGLGFHMDQDAHGRLTGSGLAGVLIGDQFVAGDYRISGQVGMFGGEPAASFVIKISGADIIAGKVRPFRISIIVTRAFVDQLTDTIHTDDKPAKVVGHISGLGSINGEADFETPLPANMTGEWTLSLDIIPLKRLGGVGVVKLSNGRELTFDVDGKFVPGARTKLRLTGVGEASGSFLNVFMAQDLSSVTVENSKVMNQKIEFAPSVSTSE
jgi:hypothetical protein